mmetsp:Transcript_35905/g.113574  ORF Transcript_35905/g.113574 Transcript_35905/m.113574 type:complete len:160 (-) Transcript_35905:18-497(-)
MNRLPGAAHDLCLQRGGTSSPSPDVTGVVQPLVRLKRKKSFYFDNQKNCLFLLPKHRWGLSPPKAGTFSAIFSYEMAFSRRVAAFYGILVAAVGAGWLPLTCAASGLASLPLALNLARYVNEHHDNKEKIFFGKYLAVRWHAAHGMALALALAAGRWAA